MFTHFLVGTLVLIASFSRCIFAEEKSNTQLQSTERVETKMPRAEWPDSTSRGNRENKRFGLLAGVGVETTTFAGHFAIDYFLKRDLVLQLKGVSESDNVDGEFENKEDSINLGLKIFQGNNFYFKPSIGYLEFTDVNYITYIFSQALQSSSDEDRLTAITGSIAIGNQWQWKNFTLGVEWVGITQSLITLESENDPDRTFLTTLQLSLGASF